MDFKSMMGAMVMAEVEKKKAERVRATPERLAELAAAYFDRYTFKPGDLVMWKPGLKRAQIPDYGEPAVVLAVQPGQVDPSTDGISSSFAEARDIRVGVLDGENEIIGWWLDSSRLMPYQPETPFEKTLTESMEGETPPSAPAEAVDAFAGHVSPTAQYEYSGDDSFGSAPLEAHDQPEKRPNWQRDPDPIAEHDRPAAYPPWPANN